MDPRQDWFMRQLLQLVDGLQELHNKGARTEIPEPTNAIKNDEILPEILKGLVAQGKVDEAENLLFRCVENYPLVENYTIGLEFYRFLAEMEPEELAASGWSREEIKEGIADLYQLVYHEPLDINTLLEKE